MRFVLVCLAAGCSFQHRIAPDADGVIASSDSGVIGSDAKGSDAPTGSFIDLRPDADTWLRQQFPTEVHGSDIDLRAGSGSSTARANRALMHFDLTGVACTITSAQLNLFFYQEDFSNVSPILEAHHVTSTWSESSATWESRSGGTAWTTAGGDFAATSDGSTIVPAGMFGWITWDLTAITKQWRSGAVANYGLLLLEPNDNAGNGGRKEFLSMQASTSTPDRRPYLHVQCD
jgi:hypothetical protein